MTKQKVGETMRYDVIINLDYESGGDEDLHDLFAEIKRAMQNSGFVMDGRRFTVDLPPAEAQSLARSAVEAVEQRHQRRGMSIIPYIREFFGFEPSNTSNLLLPPTEEILVRELAESEGLEVVDLFKPH
jgi:hypothetical protein